jgi:uncharacterized membrane protein
MAQGDPLDEQHSIKEIKQKIKWVNTISITAIHLLALYSVFTITHLVRWQTILWGECLLRYHYQHLNIYSYKKGQGKRWKEYVKI